MLQGCSKRRPDIYFDLPTHAVVVEVDENQHIKYDDKCECARINEIVNGIGGRPVIFIRYNPDKILNNGKKVIIPTIQRINLLLEKVKDCINQIPQKFEIKLIQLFYDDNNLEYSPIKEEIITDIVSI